MAQKTKKLDEILSLRGEIRGVISYADYFAHRPLFHSLRVKNDGEETLAEVSLTVEGTNGVLIPFKRALELPYESAVEVPLGDILSPLYFSSLEQAGEERVTVTLQTEKKIILQKEWTVKTLPFDFWQGTEGDLELLSSFVRPRLGDCAKMQTEVLSQLKKWNAAAELNGYIGNDKNAVRKIVAALYAALRKLSISKKTVDINKPVSTLGSVNLVAEQVGSPLEVALFACSCLESMGLHPVLIFGEKEITCGVWLYDACFMDTVSDDVSRLGAYIADGINNLSCFDVTDVYGDKNAAYSTSEAHFKQKLESGYYDKYVDVRRCRISKLLPLPLRAKSFKGFEVLHEEDMSPDAAPKELTAAQKLSLDEELTREKQWERRLLDMSMKNTQLNFLPTKGVVHVLSSSADDTLDALTQNEEMAFAPTLPEAKAIAAKKVHFGSSSEVKRLKELLGIENRSGILRTFMDEAPLQETLTKLLRKNKEADEESGTKILYLALGFLKWYSREDGGEHFAPLVLQPVQLKKSKGGSGYSVVLSDEELSVNYTLLEYLKQEFNIDIRGLNDAVQGLKISEILAMVRMEVINMRGWEVYDDVYLAAFSFARYQMWYDLKENMEEFAKNRVVEALMNNTILVGEGGGEALREDEGTPETVLTPLPADATQWAAIAQSKTGKCFVLHGPPGTGKSQTITNIIANALYDGKRVLFVAEKQAALSVVKKRLDGIGIGDFCLELHSGKTNKTEVMQKLNATLSLAGERENVGLSEKSQAIVKLREELTEPLVALHKRRRLGVSLYEALLLCLKHKNAPDLMNIESTFYDGLTKEKIESYEQMMLQAAAAAKECGGVHNSPFANVNITEYTLKERDSLYCASEVMIAEIKHLKNYVALFLDLYRQNISTLTRRKLETLCEIAQILDSGNLNRYFRENEEEFFAFFNANKRLDVCLEKYFQQCKKLVDIPKEYKALGAWLEGGNTDYSKDKEIRTIVKRLNKTAYKTLDSEELLSLLKTTYEIYEAMEAIRTNTKLVSYFTFAFGRIDFFDARKNFLKDLYRLHELCASVFMDYNPDSFNSMCMRASNGYSSPVLKGLMRSLESFRAAEEEFLTVTNADRRKLTAEEILDSYTAKAGALIENIDMLAGWCMYKKTAKALDDAGLTFVTDALENGSVTGETIVAGFEKNVYKNFLQTNLPLDASLARFSAAVCEERSESLRVALDEFAELTKEAIVSRLISRLPTTSTEGSLSLETANFGRFVKTNLRGMGLRRLFEEIPELIKTIAPCMLMSPMTVSQYLKAENGLFDLVIFDEASQIPTAEAVCSLARGKAVIVVGDPNQLPPTSFFASHYVDEENLENEDMESMLDDCMAINMPQRYLSWHYRSKHESLIAFSNAMYYDNHLCTFPSPDALSSKVRLEFVEDGEYDRGLTKRNKVEAEALIQEVLKRLADPVKKKSSLGIVTFSNVQKEYIEKKLAAAIQERRLEKVAYEGEEPLFVKNLENVQGDERDVILFSVCYGPDKLGRISLNFGPLNQTGGWRRLNVAVSRAREEMVVFSSMKSGMIDLAKTQSRGVAGLKAFLEFAEKGRTSLAISSNSVVSKKAGVGKYIAEELATYGYECRYDVGVSGFKIDVAVVDPKDRKKFILGVMCDTHVNYSAKDRNVLQLQTLKRNNWNVMRIFAVNYYNNPKREIKKIKDMLDKLTGADKKGGAELGKYKKAYKAAKLTSQNETAAYVTSGENDKALIERLKNIVSAEEPISKDFLIRRCLTGLGITKYGGKVEAHMQALIALCGFKYEKLMGMEYYHKTDKCIAFDRYRVESGEPLRKNETDYAPYEIISIVKGALEDKVALYMDEIQTIIASVFHLTKISDKFLAHVNDCVTLGEEKGLFVRSVSDRISMA